MGALLSIFVLFVLPISFIVGTFYLQDAIARGKRAVEEEHIESIDLIQILRGKCFDRAPNCRKESCQNYHISLLNKCKKTCGDCDQIP